MPNILDNLGAFVRIDKLLRKVSGCIDDAYLTKNKIKDTGLKTGFAKLDEFTEGLKSRDLTVVVGAPQVGKTNLALNIAANAALRDGKSVAIFSMDLSSNQIAKRLISARSRISRFKLLNGFMADEDWERYTSELFFFVGASIHIDDTLIITHEQLFQRAIEYKHNNLPLHLIIVDNLESMLPYESKNNEVYSLQQSEILRALKRLSIKMSCPVIVLSDKSNSLDCEDIEQSIRKNATANTIRDFFYSYQYADFVFLLHRNLDIKSAHTQTDAQLILFNMLNKSDGLVEFNYYDELGLFKEV